MKTKRTRSDVIYEVALGGISTAIVLLLVWLSVVVPYGTIALYVMVTIALIVPLSQRYYFATISAYIVSSLLAFAIVGDILLISGYVVYFAPMSIISGIMLEKKVNPYITIPVKVVYIGLAIAFLYYVAGSIVVSDKLFDKVPFWVVEIVGIVALLAIDFLMGYVYQAIKNKVSKVLRKRANNDENDDTSSGTNQDKMSEEDTPFSLEDEPSVRAVDDVDKDKDDDKNKECTDSALNNEIENTENEQNDQNNGL
jgi:hypothetical protein